jgi:hypothetical protein
MTTTVTTVTISTVAAMGLAGTLGVVISVVLLTLLISRQVAASAPDGQALLWRRSLNVAVLPLLISFLALVMVRALQAF